MNQAHAEDPRGERRPSTGITPILAASAVLFLGFHLVLALGREDVDRYESPLMLSVARQLVAGPWGLYGPFGGSNPLVLIHAPLYYRVSGLAAWPLARAGLHPAEAARLGGRLVSALGLVATLGAAYRLGRLGGLPGRAGWWSALLVASSPVLAGQPFAVRPDMLGVALQAWGVALALGRRRSGWASALFGLGACAKQHLVAGWAVSVGLAAWDWVRGRRGLGSVAWLVGPGAAVAGSVYGAEWVATGGRVWEATFVAAANVARVHPGDWLHVGTVVAAMVGKGAGLVALAVAAASHRAASGWFRVVASPLVGGIALLSVAQLVSPAPWVTATLPLVAMVGLIAALIARASPMRSPPGDRGIDDALAIYCGAEVLLLVGLCRSSSGAWINYGIPAMMFVAVLTARWLAGRADAMPRRWRAIAASAAVAVLASALMEAKVDVNRRRIERDALSRIVAATGLAPSAFFFADRPGLNRMSGRLEFVYDDWLYPAFESLRLAEPRAMAPARARPRGRRAGGRSRNRRPGGRWTPRVVARNGFRGRRPVRAVPRLDPRKPIIRNTMSETPSSRSNGGGWAPACVTAVLAVATAVAVGYWAFRGLGERDTEVMESPLILSVARQLIVGPRELYGPFDGSNPLVLIHAPLYYRVSGLAAWPLARAGLHPAEAARLGGRLVSALGLVAALGAAYRLGRLGGLPGRAGWWSALLVASSPVLAGQPFAVRPDMLGVALQAWGVALALGRRSGWASALFGLGACAKQHLVAGWAVSVGLAAWDWVRGRRGLGSVAWLVGPGAAVAGSVYGAEWVATGGRVWEAAFVAAANVAGVHPGDWDNVLVVSIGIVNRSAGIVALLVAAALIAVGRRPGILRWLATVGAAVLIGGILACVMAYLVKGSAMAGAVTFLFVSAAATMALAPGAWSVRSGATAGGVDAALGVYLAAELGLILFLARASAGAWLNYGIAAVVLVAVLAGRSLSRTLDAGAPRALAGSAVLASIVILPSVLAVVNEARRDLRVEEMTTDSLYRDSSVERSSYFFDGRPGLNRINGRLELVYDDWLYPVFESIGLAEPRSRWLRRALSSDRVRAVAKPTAGPMIEGAGVDLRRLHYRPGFRIEPWFYVWVR